MFAAAHAAAQIDATLSAQAVAEILGLAGASQDIVDRAVAAGDALIAAVAAATNVQALSKAKLDFVSAVTGNVTGAGGLVGQLLMTTTGAVNGLLGTTLDAVGKLTADLDASLNADLSAFVKADFCLDVDASAKLDANLHALIATLAKFATGVQALGPSLPAGNAPPASANALTDLLSTVQLVLHAEE